MEKWSVEKYCERLQAMKCEAHDKLWLYIEVNAKDFMNECEPGVKNLNSCCKPLERPSKELIRQLDILAVERRPEACLGCGMEHDCSVHGCAVINKAADLLRGDVK